MAVNVYKYLRRLTEFHEGKSYCLFRMRREGNGQGYGAISPDRNTALSHSGLRRVFVELGPVGLG